MDRPLRALLVEHSDDDARILEDELRRVGFDPIFDRARDRESARHALTACKYEVVFADHTPPASNALETLAIVRAQDPEVPLIAISGVRGEAAAVEVMLGGVDDYLVKADLARLLASVDRVLASKLSRDEHRKAQAQMLMTDRLASVGILAAGVAHEVNNPLAALIANLEMLSQDLSQIAAVGLPPPALPPEGQAPDPAASTPSPEAEDRVALERGAKFAQHYQEISEVLRDSREAADRMRIVVRDLKVFTRADREEKRTADVERVLESATRMAWNEIRHRARLVRNYGHVPLVDAGEARLGQVFLNLLLNAAQAIPEGQSERHQVRIATRISRPGFVTVEVSDTGGGIPPEAKQRIFEPFYTTKAAGVGSGLGLSISHRIVTSVGGEIEVESEVGKGTIFRVLLPIASGRDAGAGETPGLPRGARRFRVLVVDDDAPVAASLKRVLSARHDIEVANSGVAALELIRSKPPFDAIICDVLMPTMTGMEFYDELAAMNPELSRRIIFVTGGAFTPRAVEFLANVTNPRLDKPIEIAQLLRLIERVASGGPA